MCNLFLIVVSKLQELTRPLIRGGDLLIILWTIFGRM